MENVFIDWGVTKPHVALMNQKVTEIFIKSEGCFNSFVPCNVFMEAGCPHHFLFSLIEKGCSIFVCDGKLVKALRGDVEKTDENDVEFIRELWHQNPDAFHKLSIPEQKDIQINFLMKRYAHFMKDCTRFKNRQKAYEREFDETETYLEIVKILEAKKKEALKKVKPLLKEEIAKVKDI